MVTKLKSGSCVGIEMLFDLKARAYLKTASNYVDCFFIRLENWRRLEAFKISDQEPAA